MIAISTRVTTAVAATLFSANTFAFDDNRQGFFFSVGAGLQTVNVETDVSIGATSSDSSGGIATSFKIGGGISNQFSMYYIRNASWFRAEDSFGDTNTFLAGISGLGGTYYLQPTSPSAYLMAAIGFGDYSAPFEDGADADVGSAYMLGAGYEFSTHKSVEASALFVDAERSDFEDSTARSFQVTFNYTWY